MASYAFVLPFAAANEMSTVLLAERNLIVDRDAGKTVKGYIPDWAGQWGLIGTEVASSEDPETAATRALREQAGLDVSDPDVVTNFVLGNRGLVELKTDDLQQFHVLCIFTTTTALSLVVDAANSVISGKKTLSGMLSSTRAYSVDKARLQLGATPAPSNGWQSYLVTNYYDGTAPGPLNTEISTLTTILTNNAKQDYSFFSTALVATES